MYPSKYTLRDRSSENNVHSYFTGNFIVETLEECGLFVFSCRVIYDDGNLDVDDDDDDDDDADNNDDDDFLDEVFMWVGS